MSEHRNLIAKTLLDPRYANTGLTLVELFDKVKDSNLFSTKESLSKVLSKMHGSNLVKRSIATKVWGSRWSITIKGRDLYRGAFDHTKQKLEMVDNPVAQEAFDEIEVAADALPESTVNAVFKHLDDAKETLDWHDKMKSLDVESVKNSIQASKAAPSPLSVDEIINADGRADFDSDYQDDFGQTLFKLGFLHQKEIEAAKKQSQITNIAQKIEDLKMLNEGIRLLAKQNVSVLDELIAELTELL